MALENLDKSLSTLVDQINQLVTSQSADAVILAGQLLQLDAQGRIAFVSATWIVVGVCIAASCFLGGVATILHKVFRDDAGGFTGGMAAFFAMAAMVSLLVSTIAQINTTFDYTLQASAKDPKIALARSIINKMNR